jgi:inner membrane protein
LPTIITHALVSGAAVTAIGPKNRAHKLWIPAIVCSVLPDADVIGFSYGVPYASFFGHRGLFHSPFFALLLSVLIVVMFYRRTPLFSNTWWKLTSFLFVVGVSHGILDAFTNGGSGVALLTPFDDTRYFFPWRPIMVAPIGIRAFFSEWGKQVIIFEANYVWLPLLVAVTGWRVSRYWLFRRRDAKVQFPRDRRIQ